MVMRSHHPTSDINPSSSLREKTEKFSTQFDLQYLILLTVNNSIK